MKLSRHSFTRLQLSLIDIIHARTEWVGRARQHERCEPLIDKQRQRQWPGLFFFQKKKNTKQKKENCLEKGSSWLWCGVATKGMKTCYHIFVFLPSLSNSVLSLIFKYWKQVVFVCSIYNRVCRYGLYWSHDEQLTISNIHETLALW